MSAALKSRSTLAVIAAVVVLGGLAYAVELASDDSGNATTDASEVARLLAVGENTVVLDNHGEKIGELHGSDGEIPVRSDQISPHVKEAVVAIEDERFYQRRPAAITRQLVTGVLGEQGDEPLVESLDEFAIASDLERQWDKDKILTQYLNTIYFGEGAYGIEAAARTYFGSNHPGCGTDESDTCASQLLPEEAALLAGIISSPSAYSPKYFPEESKGRRDLVLQKMKDQGVLSDLEFEEAVAEGLPAPSTIEKPQEDSLAPYFTSWLRPLVAERWGLGRGLTIKSTLDLDMQETVEGIAEEHLAEAKPTASVVVLDNASGEIRAMVGGTTEGRKLFNLATQSLRQPGSVFKPFILATALEHGRTTDEVFESRVKEFPVPGAKGEVFVVRNYGDSYLGSVDLITATIYSDNSVYAELGLQLGTGKIAKLAEKMGIESNVSDSPAMTLGALNACCSPLEMTHAYQTLASGGYRLSGQLDTLPGNEQGQPRDDGPVPIDEVLDDHGQTIDENEPIKESVLEEEVAEETKSILRGVIDRGTGDHASLDGDEWGKTGTTEGYGDAWFCGATQNFTACVWVGHPNSVKPMRKDYGGKPVAGGTYPAEIWASVMSTVEGIYGSYGGTPGAYGGSPGSATGPDGGKTPTPAPSGAGGP